jgi:Zn-dependent peptidase ImmA (M78 family)
MNIKEIEQRVGELLKEANLNHIPVPVEDIAAHFKLRIGRKPSKDFSGFVLRKDGAGLIGINSDESPRRQRFTIAHELGHFFLHPSKEAFVDYRQNAKKHPRTLKEREADLFAASLLMPRMELSKDFAKIAKDAFFDQEQIEGTITFLAHRYEVSEEAMHIRLMTLGMVANP